MGLERQLEEWQGDRSPAPTAKEQTRRSFAFALVSVSFRECEKITLFFKSHDVKTSSEGSRQRSP